MADKKKFSKAPSQKQKFQFTGLEPKMKYKGDPYESIKDTDTEVDMKDMAAVFKNYWKLVKVMMMDLWMF
jgi:hypothetical protein